VAALTAENADHSDVPGRVAFVSVRKSIRMLGCRLSASC